MSSAPPTIASEQARLRDLRSMKRRATGLLVLITVIWAVVTFLTKGRSWYAYVLATAEASMVGALADWFAVTALFRHPLGLPIPHTAIIVARKDQFGRTLGAFVQENFLSADVIGARVRSGQLVERAARWLEEPANAEALAEHAAEFVVAIADVIRDEDIHPIIAEEVERAIRALPLAPLAGRALRTMTAEGRHQELLDAVLAGLERFLDENQDALRARFAEESPWWLPDAAQDRIFERLLDGVRSVLRDATSDGGHELRQRIDTGLVDLARRLETSPQLAERTERIKRDLLTHAELRRWSSSMWTELRARLRVQASEPDSELRRRIADALCLAGRRVREEPPLLARVEQMVESGARELADRFHDELAGLVEGTIARWNAAETAHRLELLLGRDLQFIRINGTIVGGLAGLVIYSVGRSL